MLININCAKFEVCAVIFGTIGIFSKIYPVDRLVCAATVLVPYVVITDELTNPAWTGTGVILVLVVAIFSYIDPIVAIFLSAVLLQEKMDGLTILGAMMILGAAICSELHV